MILTAEEKKKFAELLNARIDIPWVPEALEGPIFSHAVTAIGTALQDALPEALGELLRDPSQGIDPAEAKALGERLVGTLNKKIDLPYFDETQEASFIKTMIDPLVEAMSNGQTIDSALDRAKQRVGDRLRAGLDPAGS
jgi:hypothetical protein